LGTFGINLNGNPTLGRILTQVRGEKVEVAAPNPISERSWGPVFLELSLSLNLTWLLS